MNRLKELRAQKGLTQDELGKKLNVRSNTISNYEIGERNISIKNLIKMRELFGVSIDYILGL